MDRQYILGIVIEYFGGRPIQHRGEDYLAFRIREVGYQTEQEKRILTRAPLSNITKRARRIMAEERDGS